MYNWKFKHVVYTIVNEHRPYYLIWLLMINMIINSFIIPFANATFTTKLSIDFELAIRCLMYNIFFEMVSSYFGLLVNKNNKDFMLDIQSKFIIKICNRIYGMNWNKIKELNKNELPDKINRATYAVENLILNVIDKILQIFMFIGNVIIIYNISLISLILVIGSNMFLYFYIKHINYDILIKRKEIHTMINKFWNIYWQTLHNCNEYIIHHQKDKIVNITKQSKYDIEKAWLEHNYGNEIIMFKSRIVNYTILLIAILVYINNNIFSVYELFIGNSFDISLINKESILIVLTLYIYLQKCSSNINSIMTFYTNYAKWEKDYDVIGEILEDSEERIIADQIKINHTLEFENIKFQYKETEERKSIEIETVGKFSFAKGDTVHIKGTSGAGKSTLYDIMTGTIPYFEVNHCNVYVDGQKTPNMFHNIETTRTMVLQDVSCNLQLSCYEIITDTMDNNDTVINFNDNVNKVNKVNDEFVWSLLKMVKLDDIFTEQFDSNIHCELKDKLSGGQKTRLQLARALFRASEHCGNSSVLILDEPDKGLPADMTVEIINNIIKWFRSRGILFLTLHTKEAHSIVFDQTIQITNGIIKLVD